ncbi:NAD(P)-dependent alcohol dehydrogenase [Reichenbachiella ulvae]|uniref:NAD(P)-dependent alcohol dehydrogenase n=1 Tax=Reichenbachiella ulvae TaxID=2980104 RepID=A0ABT3CVN8_9BACT|nr:NAD(P)-dependent alcohol dehydrogenase [Reichenbachiella ulvae]MCV9387634.1 NAD(P)-dependent alcohol dehydrogenase [Reichenbachiella ulvae]
MQTNKMNAIVANGYGSPEVFQYQEVERPEPKADEVLVRVVSTSATRADTMMRTGKPYFGRLFVGLTKPKSPIPGTGFAGYVEEVGSAVSRYKKGDRVFGETTLGFSANAEFLVIKEEGVILPLPENLDFAEAAVFCDGHLTSFNFLYQIAQIKKGQHWLINGASGSLGSSAVQLAKYFGADVTAVTSTKNVGLVKSLGADHVIDYSQEDFHQSETKFDCVYDSVGKSSFGACKSILKEEGSYLSPVLSFSLLGQMLWTQLFGKKKARFEATGLKSDDQLRELLEKVVEVQQSGKLKTIIDRQFPLAKLSEAHRYIDTGHKRGNVVLLTA